MKPKRHTTYIICEECSAIAKTPIYLCNDTVSGKNSNSKKEGKGSQCLCHIAFHSMLLNKSIGVLLALTKVRALAKTRNSLHSLNSPVIKLIQVIHSKLCALTRRCSICQKCKFDTAWLDLLIMDNSICVNLWQFSMQYIADYSIFKSESLELVYFIQLTTGLCDSIRCQEFIVDLLLIHRWFVIILSSILVAVFAIWQCEVDNRQSLYHQDIVKTWCHCIYQELVVGIIVNLSRQFLSPVIASLPLA